MANSNMKPAICVPAMLYLVLSVIALISMAFNNCMGMCLLFKVIFIAIWTWFLNFLCKQGYTTISWILVLLPFIMFILMILFAYEVMKRVKNQESFVIHHPYQSVRESFSNTKKLIGSNCLFDGECASNKCNNKKCL
jgi:hypothetical protein